MAPLRAANRAVSGAEKTLQGLEATLKRARLEFDGLSQREANANRALVKARAWKNGHWLRQRWERLVSNPEEKARLAEQWMREGERLHALAERELAEIPRLRARLETQLDELPSKIAEAQAKLEQSQSERETLRAELGVKDSERN
ncbi:MAG: hypothetical protein HY394_04495 [Candidatus Diapherotrites archaeon]|nr:hypothetical protein [Candidatus Diapherotrites archaeon]